MTEGVEDVEMQKKQLKQVHVIDTDVHLFTDTVTETSYITYSTTFPQLLSCL